MAANIYLIDGSFISDAESPSRIILTLMQDYKAAMSVCDSISGTYLSYEIDEKWNYIFQQWKESKQWDVVESAKAQEMFQELHRIRKLKTVRTSGLHNPLYDEGTLEIIAGCYKVTHWGVFVNLNGDWNLLFIRGEILQHTYDFYQKTFSDEVLTESKGIPKLMSLVSQLRKGLFDLADDYNLSYSEAITRKMNAVAKLISDMEKATK